MTEERNFMRKKLLEKYTAKMLYGWDDRKFENKYLRKLERNSENESQFIQRRNLERGVMSELKVIDFTYFHFLSHFYFLLFSILELRVRV